MKYLKTVIIATFMVIFSSVGMAQTDDELTKSLDSYMRTYPQSHLRDLYKFCFQDFFGLEHLLTDSLAAARYIEKEVASMGQDPSPEINNMPTLTGRYVRVDLNLVRTGKLSVGALVSAMFRSLDEEHGVTPQRLEEWKQQWERILLCLKNVENQPLNYDEDLTEITTLLDSGKYATHHSRHFNETYRQHYRIVSRKAFENLIQLKE